MSWSSKKIFSFLVGASVLSSAIVGCAGSDASTGPNPGTPVVPASGGVTQFSGTSNETRASQESPQQVQVTVNGEPTTGFLPGGDNLATGEQVAFFPKGQLILQGLTISGGGNSANQSRGEAGAITIRNRNSNIPYDTGVRLLSNGTLSDNLILSNGDYEVKVQGTLAVARDGKRLDFQTLILDGQVRNGVGSVPQVINGQLPVNGGSSFPLRLDIQMPPQFNAGFVKLRVIHDNGILQQQHALASGYAQFHDLQFAGNSVIPPTGLNTVEFRYSDTPFND